MEPEDASQFWHLRMTRVVQTSKELYEPDLECKNKLWRDDSSLE